MKYYIITIITFLIVINLYTNIRYKKQSNNLKNELSVLEEKYNFLNDLNRNNLKNEKHAFENSLMYNGKKVSSKAKLQSGNNEKIDFNRLFPKNHILIYRISENVCSICYDETIEKLMSFSEDIGSSKILILVPLKRIRELRTYLKEFKSNIRFYGVKENTLGLNLDNFSPFFFILNKNGGVEHIFEPLKVDKDNQLENYFGMLKYRYFDTE
ncbi:hypothetical protein [Maribacter sp. 2304DJ31-5]|uniref:hypothetical protein n=1 Tax=Maribacter sp. 2304DJ31-5 TaxID=3386273 RepID=UPI0039BCBB36